MCKAVVSLLALVGLLCGTHLLAQPESEPDAPQAAQEQPEPDGPSPIERGRYLVHHVAQCVQCHTPRTERGELIRRRLLRGAPIPVPAPYEGMPWAFQAPQLAGLPGWTEREIVVLLMTGRRPNGHAPRPPMPTFQMTEEDATAVAAYLDSLVE